MKTKLLCIMMMLLLPCSFSHAGPAAPEEIDIQESDGARFKAKIHGDEFQSWVEAVDSGHTILHNKNSGRWEYAEKLPDGSLKPSGIKVDPTGEFAPGFLKRGVKPERDLERERQQSDSLKKTYEDRMGPSFSSGSETGDSQFSDPLAAPGDWVATPVSGTRPLLVILINFANRTLTTTADSWYQTIFNTTAGVKSVANFYSENSFGNLSLVPAFTGGSHPGVVSVTIADNHPNSGQSTNYAVETTIISHALAQAAATVDLSGFDPATGSVYLIYAGYEASGGIKTPNIWAHAWSGSVTGGPLTISRWALNGELNNSDLQHPMGVIAHELGHALCGLPDLYDTASFNAGLGYFSLMSSGSWGRLPGAAGGSTPVALDAWSREYLGWTAPLTPVASGPVSLAAALASADNALKLINTSTLSSEYWLAENRHPTAGGWDEGLTGLVSGYTGGMLITHIDITAGTQGGNNINRYVAGVPQGVVPVQGSTAPCNMLASGTASSCRGTTTTTFYSGNNADLSNATIPSSKYYSGAVSNRGLTAISARGATMTANVMVTTTADITKPIVTAFTAPAVATTLTIPINSYTASDNVAVASYLVTETSTVPLASNSGWNATPRVSYTFATVGAKKLYGWAKDTAGNVSPGKLAAVTIDQTAPVVSAIKMPVYYNKLTVPVVLTAKDNVKLAGYRVTTSSSAPAASDPNWKTTASLSCTFATLGTNTLYAWAKDTAGNVSLSKSGTVLIETAPPTVNTFTVAALAPKVIPILAFSASDAGGSGIGGYRITETATAPLATATGWKVTVPTTYTTATGGNKTLYAWAKDAAGNVSLAKTATLLVDIVKPLVTFTAPAVATTLTIPINSYTASDNLAVASYLVTETGTAPLLSNPGWSATPRASYTFATVGAKKLYGWARDTAGNVSLGKLAAVAIDQSAPVVSAVKAPAYYKSLTVPFTVTAKDNVKIAGYLVTASSSAPAVSDTNWKTTAAVSCTFTTTGTKTFYAWAKDTAGYVSLSKSGTVLIETAPPTVNTFTVAALAPKVIPIVAFNATDVAGGSGISGYRITETATAPLATATGWKVTAPATYTTATGGNKTLYAWAKDAAGNVSLAKTATLLVDITKPIVTAFSAPATSTSLTVPINSYTASDNVAVALYLVTESATVPLAGNSGWNATPRVSYTFATKGSKKLYPWAKDTAGNVSPAKYLAIVLN